MRLDSARLCLDCEEVHDDQVCPRCGSEAFAFLTRWVEPSPAPRLERPARARTVELDASAAATEQVEAYRQLLSGEPAPRGKGLLAKSLVGLAAFGLAGWFYRTTRQEMVRKEEGTRKKEEGTETKQEGSRHLTGE